MEEEHVIYCICHQTISRTAKIVRPRETNRTGVRSEMCSPTLTDWERPVKYECSQESRLGGRFVEFNL